MTETKPCLETRSVDGNSGEQQEVQDGQTMPVVYDTFGIFWTFIDALGLLLTLLIQGSYLNYYIIYFNQENVFWYFWFLIDFIILIVFIFAIICARKERQRKVAVSSHDIRGPETNTENGQRKRRIGKAWFNLSFPRSMGSLPLIYLSWLGFSLVLVIKICIIFKKDIPKRMYQEKIYNGDEIILLCIAASSVIFLLWVEAHRSLEDEDCKELTKACTNDLINHTVFEIFDSVFFLDLICPNQTDFPVELKLGTNKPGVSPVIENLVITLAAINFVLPTLGLLRLSRYNFGCRVREDARANKQLAIKSKISDDKSIIGLNVTSHFLRLFFINIPYLWIRVHLSVNYDKEISIFILKNVLGIMFSLKCLIIEFKQFLNIRSIEGNPKIKIETIKDKNKGWEMPVLLKRNPPRAGDEELTTISKNDENSLEVPVI